MIRRAERHELAELSDLCLRSKAHWGYDAAFISACRDELTLTPEMLGPGLVVWDDKGQMRAICRVTCAAKRAELDLLYVDPNAQAAGLGRTMFNWALVYARDENAISIEITADPHAQPFYERMGAVKIGVLPSGSIQGRLLPVLELALTRPTSP